MYPDRAAVDEPLDAGRLTGLQDVLGAPDVHVPVVLLSPRGVPVERGHVIDEIAALHGPPDRPGVTDVPDRHLDVSPQIRWE